MIFSSVAEDRLNKKIDKEKEYLWNDINEIKKSLEQFEKSLSALETSTPEHHKKVVGARNDLSRLRGQANERMEKIEDYYVHIKEGAETASSLVKTTTESIEEIKRQEVSASQTLASLTSDHQDYINKKSEIESAIDELKNLIDEKDVLSVKIESLSEQVGESEEISNRLKLLVKNSNLDRNKIRELHSEVFGYTEENEFGEQVTYEGLKDELESSYKQIKADLASIDENLSLTKNTQIIALNQIENDYKESLDSFIQKAEISKNAVVEQLKSLLPDALTAGLSGAYVDKIKVEKEQLIKHEASFNKAILGLILCSLIPVAFSILRILFLKEPFDIVIKDAPMLYSMMLPVYAPILWVAYSSNKSYKLSKRLIEEYTHKEVSSRTFEGLSNQINNIGEDDTSGELRTKLLFNLLQVNSENPGKLISDYNNSDHPIIDAIDKSSKLADAINRLDNVPLVSPLLKHLNAKEKTKLEQRERDMLAVVDVETSEDANQRDKGQPEKEVNNG
ncbi:hypothetical protein OPW41_21130 [Vibrio europaeus]|uniref:Chromosome partition protein Smc n=1 Tax=Vibrio europaeus TaxID=300876 RepID=A0A178JG77_9VIBR|nr:hypothetical protein [Vibrio europaeus]MDC5707325.1 hypothetical protein [Vibrio europaeus]MDC5712690.1 hypothetical protein [Vibrio europaeus]MDC5717333.1 hypothetical protein [Vibrio europaeus]MDC5721133.1 hypothetical protein [Vibrio europaeus]MDC5726633.1 hypothetical protein [Vibrio europaeus]